MDYREIQIYLQAVKDSHNTGNYSKFDCELLGYLYVQGRLHMEIAKHPQLFNDSAKNDVIRFAKWVRNNLESPQSERFNDLSFKLNRLSPYAEQTKFNTAAVSEITQYFKLFFSDFIASIQVDILAMSIEASSAGQTSLDDANYSIGMAEITCQNLVNIFSDPDFYLKHDLEKIEGFVVDSCRFLSEIKKFLHKK